MFTILATTASKDITPEVLYFGASAMIAALISVPVMIIEDKNHPERKENEHSVAEFIAIAVFIISFAAFLIWDMLRH